MNAEEKVRARWKTARALTAVSDGPGQFAIFTGPRDNRKQRRSSWFFDEREAWADAWRKAELRRGMK